VGGSGELGPPLLMGNYLAGASFLWRGQRVRVRSSIIGGNISRWGDECTAETASMGGRAPLSSG